MDFQQMIKDLRVQRDAVSEAITVLERLASGHGHKRRGRPPKWMRPAGRDVLEAAIENRTPIAHVGRRKK